MSEPASTTTPAAALANHLSVMTRLIGFFSTECHRASAIVRDNKDIRCRGDIGKIMEFVVQSASFVATELGRIEKLVDEKKADSKDEKKADIAKVDAESYTVCDRCETILNTKDAIKAGGRYFCSAHAPKLASVQLGLETKTPERPATAALPRKLKRIAPDEQLDNGIPQDAFVSPGSTVVGTGQVIFDEMKATDDKKKTEGDDLANAVVILNKVAAAELAFQAFALSADAVRAALGTHSVYLHHDEFWRISASLEHNAGIIARDLKQLKEACRQEMLRHTSRPS